MSDRKIRQLLEELRAEIDKGDFDDAVGEQIEAFDQYLHQRLEEFQSSENAPAEDESMMGTARQLEALFDARHPNAALFMREIIDTLAKMGI